MKHKFSFSFLSALFIILWGSSIVAQCPNQLTNQSASITLSPGYPRSYTAATGVQIGASCGLHIVGDLGAVYARYEIPINVADNALIAGDQIEISMDITNVTANFRYDLTNGGSVLDTSAEPVSGRIITIPSGATTLRIRLFPNLNQNDVSGSFDISNLSVSKVGSGSNDTQAPTAPTLSSTGQTETTANLSWSGASDDVGITGYRIFRDGTLETTLGNVSTYQITGLSANTSYSFKLRALDAAGNESVDSNILAVTTDSSSGGSGTNGNVTWTKSGSNVSMESTSDNLAIGRSTVPAGYKLAVEGNIRTREIRVDQENWPDYVFKEGYSLPSLEEIQKHIREKGHLPNIPSAKEVEQNGIELGEMNKLLLEKIEELTLYILNQEKRLNDQNFEIERLKAKQ